MQLIELKGSPYEIGFQHGRIFKERIKEWVPRYCRFEGWSAVQLESVQRRSEIYMMSFFPDLLEEMRGIAAGAEMKYEDLFLVNMFPSFPYLTPSCTCIAFKATDLGPMLGHNGDGGVGEPPTILRRTQLTSSDGYSSLTASVWVGTVWGIGMNEHGFCLVCSSAHPVDTENRDGICIWILLKGVLQHCRNVTEAIELMSNCRIVGKGATVLVVDASGDAAVVEIAPHKAVTLRTESNAIWCTNHYTSGEIEYRDEPEYIANSMGRYQKLTELSETGGFEFSLEGMKRVLTDHDQPGAICQHKDRGQIMETYLSMILLSKGRKILFADGAPCQNDYVEFEA